MDKPAKKINVTIHGEPNPQPDVQGVGAAASTNASLDSAMTEAINAIDISADGKISSAASLPEIKPVPGDDPKTESTSPETAQSMGDEPESGAESQQPQSPESGQPEPTKEEPAELPMPNGELTNVPKFAALQPKIDDHPLFSGSKEPKPKSSSRKGLLGRTLIPLVSLLVAAIILFLLVDSGVVRGASHLPFHIFKQPVASVAPAIQQPAATVQPTTTTTADPYAGWKSASSPRAKFSIKYPSTWTYKEQLGDKDGVEHITIDSTLFHIAIDSSIGNSGHVEATGATANATCVDCTTTNSSQSFPVNNLGKVNLDNVIYTIDTGKGNALVLRLADGTYGLKAPNATNIYTNFRGISILGSKQAYQAETPAQFVANPDYVTAQNILKSLSY